MKNRPRVCIVGVGLIGGSLALSLRRSGAVSCIVGVSRPETLRAAEALGALDEGFGYEELAEAVKGCDIVVLAAPIKRILSLLERLGEFDLPEGLIVTDVGSTKGLIVEAAGKNLPEGVVFIGGHPMAGSEKSGIGAADPFLFQNAIYVLCPGKNVSLETAEELGTLLEKTGARVMVMDADTHDRTVAAVSHLPQFVAVALVDFAARRDAEGCHALKLAAGEDYSYYFTVYVYYLSSYYFFIRYFSVHLFISPQDIDPLVETLLLQPLALLSGYRVSSCI